MVRVDSRRTATDLPPGRVSPRTRLPTGGWWNYGGILREVYLQKIDTLAIESALVTPRLRCTTCAATTVFQTRAAQRHRRPPPRDRHRHVRLPSVRLGARTLRPGATASFRGSLSVPSPHLWSPRDPFLYPAAVEVRVGGRLVGRWSVQSGVRSVRVDGGRLTLNGRPVQLRGVGLHEDNAAQGFAVDNTWRRWLVDRAKELGATMLRTHYPMHPYIHEVADREGLLIWSEIPVYSHKSSVIDDVTPRARRRAAPQHRDQRQPSLGRSSGRSPTSCRPSRARPRAPTSAGRRAPRTSSTPRARSASPSPATRAPAARPATAPLDVIGINDYFGWYPGPQGSLFDRERLSPYLDALRRCYPADALMVTEFGAEANRDGLGRGQGHLRVPAGLRELPAERLRHQAVAERRPVLGAQRVPRAARPGTAATRSRRRRSTRRR